MWTGSRSAAVPRCSDHCCSPSTRADRWRLPRPTCEPLVAPDRNAQWRNRSSAPIQQATPGRPGISSLPRRTSRSGDRGRSGRSLWGRPPAGQHRRSAVANSASLLAPAHSTDCRSAGLSWCPLGCCPRGCSSKAGISAAIPREPPRPDLPPAHPSSCGQTGLQALRLSPTSADHPSSADALSRRGLDTSQVLPYLSLCGYRITPWRGAADCLPWIGRRNPC